MDAPTHVVGQLLDLLLGHLHMQQCLSGHLESGFQSRQYDLVDAQLDQLAGEGYRFSTRNDV